MELQFQSTPVSYLQSLSHQTLPLEQTQEVRLADGMPDIGAILGTWAQMLLRGKQWNTGSMGVSAGAMVWVLYEPEEGGAPAVMETWVPFQQKFDLPDTEGREGRIHCRLCLAGADARSTSARKMIIRVNGDISAEAMLPEQAELFIPAQVPEDVQLLRNAYPVLLPAEAGEKPCELEEQLSLPAGNPPISKIISYQAYPRVQEKKILSDKVIFRGSVGVHLLYIAQDGMVSSWDFEVPFSQYGELDREYEPDASVNMDVQLTSMELSVNDQGLLDVQMGLVGQYVVCQRHLLDLIEDAYSTIRDVQVRKEQLPLPSILDMQEKKFTGEEAIPAEASRVADTTFYSCSRKADMGSPGDRELTGQFQSLYYDMEGKLRSGSVRWEQPWSAQAEAGVDVRMHLIPGMGQGTPVGGSIQVHADITAATRYTAQQGMEMVSALELGEPRQPDPQRPSVILRRAGEDSLWQIAKDTGSTVEAIRSANLLEQEPNPERFLLIPVS